MQIVGYDTGVGNLEYDPADGISGTLDPPALILADNSAIHRHSLEPGTVLEYTLGERHCAGVLSGDEHTPCAADEAPQCPEHTVEWPCARCTGQCNKPIKACEEEHAVYLAAFAPSAFKVGVTRVWRLAARLREQGADRAAHIHTVSDGRIARRIERELTTSLPDRVPTTAKLAGLHRTVDTDEWHAVLRDFTPIDTLTFNHALDLEDRPVHEILVTGTVHGTKGRILVLESTTGVYAVDLRELVGFELHEGATARDLQSSLGAFG